MDWAKPFAALAADCGLDYTAASAHERVEEYWQTVYSGART
jgi:hypothetical protein